jgi:lipopolysaccharide/colanic/teichoic acid biosynthesis glycosyltransferase
MQPSEGVTRDVVEPGALAVKRGLDIVARPSVSFCSCRLLAVALAVKCTSPGAILYRGERTGRFGRPFRILKFRTMVEGAERLGGPTTGTKDRRITNIGRFLRRSKLDELPQLLNVLTGERSLVGPRPEVPKYTALYSEEESMILSVRPGSLTILRSSSPTWTTSWGPRTPTPTS